MHVGSMTGCHVPQRCNTQPAFALEPWRVKEKWVRCGEGRGGDKITKREEQTQKELATPKLQMTNQEIQIIEPTVRRGNCAKWNSFYRIV